LHAGVIFIEENGRHFLSLSVARDRTFSSRGAERVPMSGRRIYSLLEVRKYVRSPYGPSAFVCSTTLSRATHSTPNTNYAGSLSPHFAVSTYRVFISQSPPTLLSCSATERIRIGIGNVLRSTIVIITITCRKRGGEFQGVYTTRNTFGNSNM
jgi:hypothetical protein